MRLQMHQVLLFGGGRQNGLPKPRGFRCKTCCSLVDSAGVVKTCGLRCTMCYSDVDRWRFVKKMWLHMRKVLLACRQGKAGGKQAASPVSLATVRSTAGCKTW
jgi:hypothetical protein